MSVNSVAQQTIKPDLSNIHAKIIIDTDNITVYVNDDKKPSLKIKPIINRATGKIGFWVGNNSDGDFKNLSIQSN